MLPVGAHIYTPEGHCVTAHHVGFYAADSEQSGLLARAQEIDNLDKRLRAQALMADEARTALHRAEAPTPMPASGCRRRAARPVSSSRVLMACRSRRCA